MNKWNAKQIKKIMKQVMSIEIWEIYNVLFILEFVHGKTKLGITSSYVKKNLERFRLFYKIN